MANLYCLTMWLIQWCKIAVVHSYHINKNFECTNKIGIDIAVPSLQF